MTCNTINKLQDQGVDRRGSQKHCKHSLRTQKWKSLTKNEGAVFFLGDSGSMPIKHAQSAVVSASPPCGGRQDKQTVRECWRAKAGQPEGNNREG